MCMYITSRLHLINNYCFNNYFSDKCVKGCYAVSVSGDLPPDTVDDLREKGIVYRSRDNTDR